jgi:hypothetical protein
LTVRSFTNGSFIYNSIFREYQYNLSIGEPENFVNDQSPALKCSKEALLTDPYSLLPKAKAPQAQPQVSSFNPHERLYAQNFDSFLKRVLLLLGLQFGDSQLVIAAHSS